MNQRIESNPRSTCRREAVLPLHWTRAEQRQHAYGTYGTFHVHEVRLGYLYPASCLRLVRWLQEIFDCPLVIQLTGRNTLIRRSEAPNGFPDDEKFLFKHENTVDQVLQYTQSNARDIIAVGFNPDKTFIFSNFEFMG